MVIIVTFILVAIIWIWYGIRTLVQHIKYKRLLKKYSKQNKSLDYWEKAISSNVPELIGDLKKSRGN